MPGGDADLWVQRASCVLLWTVSSQEVLQGDQSSGRVLRAELWNCKLLPLEGSGEAGSFS